MKRNYGLSKKKSLWSQHQFKHILFFLVWTTPPSTTLPTPPLVFFLPPAPQKYTPFKRGFVFFAKKKKQKNPSFWLFFWLWLSLLFMVVFFFYSPFLFQLFWGFSVVGLGLGFSFGALCCGVVGLGGGFFPRFLFVSQKNQSPKRVLWPFWIFWVFGGGPWVYFHWAKQQNNAKQNTTPPPKGIELGLRIGIKQQLKKGLKITRRQLYRQANKTPKIKNWKSQNNLFGWCSPPRPNPGPPIRN